MKQLLYDFDGAWNRDRIYATKNGWNIQYDRRIVGEVTDRVIFVPYGGDFPEGQDMRADWNEGTSYAQALIEFCENIKGSKVLRKGHVVE